MKTNESPRPSPSAPEPKKRLRIFKLEERIAPKKGGNGTKNCATATFCSSRG